MNLTATDRKALIRLASSLPKGSEERQVILAGLKKSGSWVEEQGWVPLTGSAKAKAETVTGEFRLDYAKRFGRKTVFMRDSGLFRLRAVGPMGEVYQMKVLGGQLEKYAKEVALAAKLGNPTKGMSVLPFDKVGASKTASPFRKGVVFEATRNLRNRGPM